VRSDKFREIRLKLGMNQEQYAALLGLSGKQVVSNIETGLRNPGRLAGIVLAVLDSLPKRKALELVDLMLKQGKKLE
jgi:transcriptional regulator with XRE-family HTH domain